jgi:hypothetical protein
MEKRRHTAAMALNLRESAAESQTGRGSLAQAIAPALSGRLPRAAALAQEFAASYAPPRRQEGAGVNDAFLLRETLVKPLCASWRSAQTPPTAPKRPAVSLQLDVSGLNVDVYVPEGEPSASAAAEACKRVAAGVDQGRAAAAAVAASDPRCASDVVALIDAARTEQRQRAGSAAGLAGRPRRNAGDDSTFWPRTAQLVWLGAHQRLLPVYPDESLEANAEFSRLMPEVVRTQCTADGPPSVGVPERRRFGVVDGFTPTREAAETLSDADIRAMSYDGVHWGMEVNLLKAHLLLVEILTHPVEATGAGQS